ncbi:MAG: biotin-dependent carboxyltransferase family protein [Rhodanobacteraceae bacterium]
MTIEVVKPGLLTTLQDAGRSGYTHLGIGRAGAFDVPSLRIANALCGNPPDACTLEITLSGPKLRFEAGTWIAVTGAPIAFHIDGTEWPMWAPVFVPVGATVTFGAIRAGCRSCLGVGGGFDAKPMLGSRSIDVNARLGPNEGRPLRAGDVLEVGALETGSGSLFPASSGTRQLLRKSEPDPVSNPVSKWRLDPRPWFSDAGEPLRLLPGSHLEQLTQTSRRSLFSDNFTVHVDSNRVGVRLSGPTLEWEAPIEMVSEGCVTGLMQLPPSGQPIAFGPECPVSGGYPRIGQVAAVDLPRLAQRRPGDALRFRPCTFEEAINALGKREAALRKLEGAIHQRLQQDHQQR